MSKAPAKPAEGDAAPKRSMKKIIIIAAAALLVIAGGGGGAAFFLLKKKAPEKEAEHKAEPAKTPEFLALEPMTVNLVHESGQNYLQITIVLQVEGKDQVEKIKNNMPQVKNRLILLLSSKDANEILTTEGKEKLVEEIIDRVSQPFSGSNEKQSVTGVYFTSFVVQ